MNYVPRLLLLAATILVPPLGAERLELEPEASTITFALKATGHTVEGTLALSEGSLSFPLGGGATSGRIVIDAQSANTGSAGRDKTMHREVLESEQYPQFVFTPQQLRGTVARSGASEVVLDGELAIHGVTKKVSLPTTISIDDDQVAAAASVTIPFVAWGMHDPSMLFLRVAKEVVVTLGVRGHLVTEVP